MNIIMHRSGIFELIDKCSFPKLSRSIEECQNHTEFDEWKRNLIQYFPDLIEAFKNMDLRKDESGTRYSVLSSLLILHYEYLAADNWRPAMFTEYSKKINEEFELMYEVSLSNLFRENKYFEKQQIFNACMKKFNESLDLLKSGRKPLHAEAYCFLMREIKDSKIDVTPTLVMPLTLLLIEDHRDEYKLKGLDCCSLILETLNPLYLKEGNYYEVIYETLKLTLMSKNHEVLSKTMDCLIILFHLVPSHAKVPTINSTWVVLNQMFLDPNLKLRKLLFNFMNNIIEINGVHCTPWKMFLKIICENFDSCCVDGVREILLDDILNCFENWLRYCWCVWKLAPNKQLLSVLIKILYVVQEDEIQTAKIQKIFLVLCKLSTKEEQKIICNSLEKTIHDIKSVNVKFASKLEVIKVELSLQF